MEAIQPLYFPLSTEGNPLFPWNPNPLHYTTYLANGLPPSSSASCLLLLMRQEWFQRRFLIPFSPSASFPDSQSLGSVTWSKSCNHISCLLSKKITYHPDVLLSFAECSVHSSYDIPAANSISLEYWRSSLGHFHRLVWAAILRYILCCSIFLFPSWICRDVSYSYHADSNRTPLVVHTASWFSFCVDHRLHIHFSSQVCQMPPGSLFSCGHDLPIVLLSYYLLQFPNC